MFRSACAVDFFTWLMVCLFFGFVCGVVFVLVVSVVAFVSSGLYPWVYIGSTAG